VTPVLLEDIMAYEGYDCLKIRTDRGVAFVTIDNPPINLFDFNLMQEMTRIGMELEADDDIHVVVFDSADPGVLARRGFFLGGRFRSLGGVV